MADQTGEDTIAKFGRSLRFLRQQPAESPTIQVGTHQVKIDLGSWAPLPDWARFFVELGSALAIKPAVASGSWPLCLHPPALMPLLSPVVG